MNIPVKDATAPTDKSIPPVINTIVIPTAEIPKYALSIKRFTKVLIVVKPLSPYKNAPKA